MFLATIPAVLYVDKFGRKTILIVGGIGMAISHFVVAGIVGRYGGDDGAHWPEHRAAGWVAVVFVWFYAIHFGYSWGPVAWIVVSEVYPLGMRAKGISIGASSNWLNNFAVALSTSPFINASQFGAFIFFGAVTLLGVVWVYFLLPETKGRTLEEMDEIFGTTGFAADDLSRKARIEAAIGLTALLGDDEAKHAKDFRQDSGHTSEEVTEKHNIERSE